MADETTPPVTDTTTSTTTTTEADTPAVDTPTEGDEQTTDTTETPSTETGDETETSVLGGEGDEGDDDEGDGGDQTEGDDDDAPAGAPEGDYELSLTDEEGNAIPLDAEVVAEAEPILRELNLSNDAANKLAPVAQKIMERGHAAAVQQVIDQGAEQRKAWLDEFVADETIGGKNREQTEHNAAKALDALGFPKGSDFRKLLTATGFGNQKDFIGAFAKIGEMIGEDGNFARPNAGGETETVGWSSRYKD